MNVVEKDGSSPGWNSHPASHEGSKYLMEVPSNKGANLWRPASILKARRIQFAGHCYRAENEIISSLLLWTPSTYSRSRKLLYPDVIARDAGIDKQDLMCKFHHLDWGRMMMMMNNNSIYGIITSLYGIITSI